MSTARIVVGAAGLLGSAVSTCLRSYPGTLLAVDRAGPTDGSAAQSNAAPVVVLDATTAAFADLLTEFLAGCSRAELYHTAGAVPPLRSFDDTTAEEFATAVEENLTAAYLVLHRFARVTGRLDIAASAVVVTSVGAHRAHRYLVGYDAAKAGVESVVRSLALEHGSRLSPRTIALGPVAESPSTAADGARLPALVRLVPRQRYAHLDEVARAVALFGDPSFDAATGQTLILDGGLSVQLRPMDAERSPAGRGDAGA